MNVSSPETRRALEEYRMQPRCKADRDRLQLVSSGKPDSEIWLDVRAAELYLQVSRRRIYRLVESGKLPCVRVGHKILLNKQALESLDLPRGSRGK